MIRIRKDYNDFSKRFTKFLSETALDMTLDIVSKGESGSTTIDLHNSPWGTNPIIRFGKDKKSSYIGYNPELVKKCGFTQSECDACILHEIGHHINKDIQQETELEILCDKVAVDQNMTLFMLSALFKMQDKLELDLHERIDAIYPLLNLYRPAWTCGSYNSAKHTAIIYNLVEGQAHYFDEYSADVIGKILTFGRDVKFTLADINALLAEKIDKGCLVDFAISLFKLGLLTTKSYSQDDIVRLRKEIAKKKKLIYSTALGPTENTTDLVEPRLEDAEEAYANSIDGWTNIIFELTYRCSESCIHCYNEGSVHAINDKNRRGNRLELSIDEYKRVIDEFKELGMFKICLTRGDPFSNSSVWAILEYLYKKEVAVEIYTNGYILNGQIERLLALYPRVIGISVYSGIPEIHDAVTRTQGSFERTISTMTELAKYGVPLQLKCCVFSTNFDSYQTVYDLAAQFCALPQIEINIRNTVDDNRYASEHLRLTDEQYKILFSDTHIHPTITSDTVNRFTKRDYSKNPCRAGVSSCTLTPEGNIIPCPAFHMTLGNIREMHVWEIMGSEKRTWWRSICLNDYRDCGKHDYCHLCSICPGENYSDTGNPLFCSENKCFLAKKRFEFAQELNSQHLQA